MHLVYPTQKLLNQNNIKHYKLCNYIQVNPSKDSVDKNSIPCNHKTFLLIIFV